MKSTIVILFSIFITISSFANFPADSVGTTTKSGVVYTIHEIVAGETFYALSRKYNITVEEIQKANPEASTLAVGQKILIPTKLKATTQTAAQTTSSTTSTKTHTVAAGEGLFSISKKYGVTVDEIVRWNNLTSSAINVGQNLIVSAPVANKPASQLPTASKNTTHTVAAGEGLYSISKKYDVTVDEIKKANNMTTNDLSVGQVLIIKKGEAPKSAPVKTAEPTKTTATTTTAKTPPASTVAHPQKITTTPSANIHSRKEEEGLVSLTALPQYNTKFSYGLHKTAPAGTIIKVTNKATGKFHWVRIMGTLDASETSLMKVNQTVLEKLGQGATSFEAEISYAL